MNSLLGTNIDDTRAEIMRLENAKYFDADAWSRVLADLSAAGRVVALEDAKRRMETARGNQSAVAVETDYNSDGRLKAYWVERKDDEWGMWIHAESVGKAKSIYLGQDPSLEPADFTDLRAIRPGRGADLLDCTPFTDYTLELSGHKRLEEDQRDFPEAFLDFCPCSMCRYEKTKPEYQVGYLKVEA